MLSSKEQMVKTGSQSTARKYGINGTSQTEDICIGNDKQEIIHASKLPICETYNTKQVYQDQVSTHSKDAMEIATQTEHYDSLKVIVKLINISVNRVRGQFGGKQQKNFPPNS